MKEENKKVNADFISAEDELMGYKLKSMICVKIFRANLVDDILFSLGVIIEDEFITYKVVYKADKIVFTNIKL